jgi:hypothetical protein
MQPRNLTLIALALIAGTAQAQPFTGFVGSDTTCYNWNGGNFSAGSFSKCRTDVIVAAAPPPAPVVVPAPAPSPIMMPMQSCPPPPVPVHRKYKPKPKPVCK